MFINSFQFIISLNEENIPDSWKLLAVLFASAMMFKLVWTWMSGVSTRMTSLLDSMWVSRAPQIQT